jgi:hypothetical protein
MWKFNWLRAIINFFLLWFQELTVNIMSDWSWICHADWFSGLFYYSLSL